MCLPHSKSFLFFFLPSSRRTCSVAVGEHYDFWDARSWWRHFENTFFDADNTLLHFSEASQHLAHLHWQESTPGSANCFFRRCYVARDCGFSWHWPRRLEIFLRKNLLPEDRGSRFIPNVANYLPGLTASHSRIQYMCYIVANDKQVNEYMR